MIQIEHTEWGYTATTQVNTVTFKGVGNDKETALNALLRAVQKLCSACIIAQEEIIKERLNVRTNSEIYSDKS